MLKVERLWGNRAHGDNVRKVETLLTNKGNEFNIRKTKEAKW